MENVLDSNEYRQKCSRSTLQDKKEGCFLQLVDKFWYFNPNLQIGFQSLNSDEERIKFCIENCWDSIGVQIIIRGKDLDEAKAKLNEGDLAVKNGKLEDALKIYTQGIIRCPFGSSILAKLFAKRAILHLQMKQWNFAKDDAQLALENNPIDEEEKSETYAILAEVHMHLANFPKAKVCLGIAKHFGKLNVKLEKKLNELEKSCINPSEMLLKHSSTSPQDQISKAQTGNGYIGEIRIGNCPESGGRTIFTKAKIEAGQAILVEEPISSVLLPERFGTHCHHCFSQLVSPIPCENCSLIAFCSVNCKNQSWKTYHQIECKILFLLIGSGMSIVPFLALRMITQDEAKALPNSTEGMIKNEGERDPFDFFQRTLMAVFLLKCLRLAGYFPNLNLFKNSIPNSQDEFQIGVTLLKYLQLLQFNAYEITQVDFSVGKSFESLKTLPIGLGLYKSASALDHSCFPNVARYFDGKKLGVITTNIVQKGDRIFDNYGPIWTKVPKLERLRILEGRYWFKCHCQACTENWRTLSESKIGEQDEFAKILDEAILAMEQGDGIVAKNLLLQIQWNGGIPNRTFLLAQVALRLVISATPYF